MQHNAAFHQGLHCLLRLKQPSGTEIHDNLETSACDPLKYSIGILLLCISICIGKSIRIQRVKGVCSFIKLNTVVLFLSYDVASGSEITPCNKIDKPLVVYRFTGNIMMSMTMLRT